MKKLQKITTLLACFVLLVFSFAMVGCDPHKPNLPGGGTTPGIESPGNNPDSNPEPVQTTTITLTVDNITQYLNVSFNVTKTQYNQTNNVNHEYVVETSSKDASYVFHDVYVTIYHTKKQDNGTGNVYLGCENLLSADGAGYFTFKRPGPLSQSTSPTPPVFNKVSGTVEVPVK